MERIMPSRISTSFSRWGRHGSGSFVHVCVVVILVLLLGSPWLGTIELTKRLLRGIFVNRRDTKTVPILILAYMRGGSTHLGNIMVENTAVFYSYESGWDIYNAYVSSSQRLYPLQIQFDEHGRRRKIQSDELSFWVEQLEHLFKCEFEDMPLEATTSWTVNMEKGHHEFRKCLAEHGGYIDLAKNVCQRPLHAVCPSWLDVALNRSCHQFMAATRMSYGRNIALGETNVDRYKHCMAPQRVAMEHCGQVLKQTCLKKRFRSAKLLRMPMYVIKELIDIFPQVKVIHQVRDPRAIIQSRIRGSMLSFADVGKEAKYLCQKMLSNIRMLQLLQQRHPGLVLFNSYENLVHNPTTSLERIYQHTGMPRSDKLESSLKANSVNGHNISIAWRSQMPDITKHLIDSQCSDLYKAIGLVAAT